MAGNLNAGIVTAQSITDGVNSATPELLAKGTAKVWVNFNGTGVVAIRASYNASSITDNGVGDYTVNFITAMPDANYAINGASTQSTGSGVTSANVVSLKNSSAGVLANKTTTSCTIITVDNNTDSLFDSNDVSFSIFR